MRQVLDDDLRGKMGFEGWVMSDWWAVHSTDAANKGVDQELPGSKGYPGSGDFAPGKLVQAKANVRRMARRVLLGMFR